MVQIAGSTVVVTGGQRGIGKAIVAELLRRGATKVYATARNPRPADDPRVVTVSLDVTDAESVAALAAVADDANIVINNAGIAGALTFLGSGIDAVREQFETNFFGALRVAKAFAPVLASNGGGALVDVASVLSWVAGFGGYGASKAALWSATNSLRIELAGQGTQVIGAHLSYTDTDMTAPFDVAKNDPTDVARHIVDGIDAGATEVLADNETRHFKAELSGPAEALRFA
ncbi:SDR family oxidoreductase [Mycobacterium simiae]|uniref:SDR family oxidoreductase n=2 Tax=Mycobacterium simiae TaxID=1784 RepID=UPI0004072272|nr:SDR family oxidoreductase [Mycobacterium simiae]PLV52524.1 short-chain dehydrogenase [Mycobacterium tuberculosis variant microti OV254]BBX40961.1 short-chain dehydrogenase [Mycobacterium simiae]